MATTDPLRARLRRSRPRANADSDNDTGRAQTPEAGAPPVAAVPQEAPIEDKTPETHDEVRPLNNAPDVENDAPDTVSETIIEEKPRGAIDWLLRRE